MNTNVGEPLNKKDLHYLQSNINSLLQKIDELKCTADKTKTAIIGLTESKNDHVIPDLEVNLPGYDILRCDRNRNGGGVACYIKTYLRRIKERFLLGDFNISLSQNGNYILNGRGMTVCERPVHTLIDKYQEYCQIFSLKHLTCLIRVTCSTFFVTDHSLTSSTEKIFQSGNK